MYKVVQIWPGQTVTCLHTNRPRSYLNHLVLFPSHFEMNACRWRFFMSPPSSVFTRVRILNGSRLLDSTCPSVRMYKVVQIWPGRFVCKQVTVCPGHIWTTLYYYLGSHRANFHEIWYLRLPFDICRENPHLVTTWQKMSGTLNE
jgi:hypothetical protein